MAQLWRYIDLTNFCNFFKKNDFASARQLIIANQCSKTRMLKEKCLFMPERKPLITESQLKAVAFGSLAFSIAATIVLAASSSGVKSLSFGDILLPFIFSFFMPFLAIIGIIVAKNMPDNWYE